MAVKWYLKKDDASWLTFWDKTSIDVELKDNNTRIVLKIPGFLSPYKLAILPLVKKDGLADHAREINVQLREVFSTFYDQSGAIGRRYRRQDEIGTPYCVTIDYDSLKDNTVTVRFRDSMEQERVPRSSLVGYLNEAISNYRRSTSTQVKTS